MTIKFQNILKFYALFGSLEEQYRANRYLEFYETKLAKQNKYKELSLRQEKTPMNTLFGDIRTREQRFSRRLSTPLEIKAFSVILVMFIVVLLGNFYFNA